MRIAHLAEDPGFAPVLAGLYACSPTGAGYEAEFEYPGLELGRLARA